MPKKTGQKKPKKSDFDIQPPVMIDSNKKTPKPSIETTVRSATDSKLVQITPTVQKSNLKRKLSISVPSKKELNSVTILMKT